MGSGIQERDDATPSGPACWRNWRAARERASLLATVEVSFFSDAWFVGFEAVHGPYRILNALPDTSRRGGMYEWKPGLVLRAKHHIVPSRGDLRRTDDSQYHGGWIYDEVAALLALVLGARIVAGSVERMFGMFGDTDPMGRPRGQSSAVRPTLPARTDEPTIPALFGQRGLEDASLLGTFADLSAEAATGLVKSARAYQQALWICDTSPEISWLLLVSAIETAAGCWRASAGTPAENLTAALPRVAALLLRRGDEELLHDAAAMLAHLTGSTSKFVAFTTRFASEPPDDRPVHGRAELEGDGFRRGLKAIYGYRSRALHGGTPFPYPMCRPPQLCFDDSGLHMEVPSGLAPVAWGRPGSPRIRPCFSTSSPMSPVRRSWVGGGRWWDLTPVRNDVSRRMGSMRVDRHPAATDDQRKGGTLPNLCRAGRWLGSVAMKLVRGCERVGEPCNQKTPWRHRQASRSGASADGSGATTRGNALSAIVSNPS